MRCMPPAAFRRPASLTCCAYLQAGGRRQLTNAAAIVDELKSRQLPIRIDDMSAGPSQLLRAAVSDFLPPDWSPRQRKFLPIHESSRSLPNGHHLVHFPPLTTEKDLLEDGTDVLHAPDRSWKYRLWAGGNVQYHRSIQLGTANRSLALVERIGDVKVRDSKVFVQIQRAIVENESSGATWGAPKADEAAARLRSIAFPDTGRHTDNSRDTRQLYARENRWLCFTQNKPTNPPPPFNPPTKEPFYTATLTPTPSLLFRFSALTFNAHAIHIDAEYTKSIYGLPERLVQGPLTLVLMLEVARRATGALYETMSASGAGTGSKQESYYVDAIDYKNHAPLYVNEEITVACAWPEDLDSTAAAAAPRMSVWIQKSHPQMGEPTVCASGTVPLRRLPMKT
ncbi:uncharacterized protein HMPREF1541_03971 [Cyphellophora europaea CBS 101466]|uniref:MaoC-like domain-containing protein n=1 Tax=Cyphellophora europaea (strain CBS 101466) TaxID=1220924 RepID=W2S019_CYPE1|nr:uncharacterized protein HMPREF1541_03971 [Cyphellophora europaea CBS 101466]ETN42032.1 hypothetical protein HMPREF1541_03971 [Cyphellophora europaea CBS 101466]